MDRKRRISIAVIALVIALGGARLLPGGPSALGAQPPAAAAFVLAGPAPAVAPAAAPEAGAAPSPGLPGMAASAMAPAAAAAPLFPVATAPAALQPGPAAARAAGAPAMAEAGAPAPMPAPLPAAAAAASASHAAAPLAPAVPAPGAAAAPGAEGCAPALTLAPAPSAMIALELRAPCHPGARVVIRHAGLAFTARTDASGEVALLLPALEAMAEVIAALPGVELAAQVAVPEVEGFARTGVLWQGEDRFALHAFERGAGFGAPGHISADRPGSPFGPGEAGGFLTRLGSAAVERPLFAEVYSRPRALADEAVAVEIEAPVTPATCGREMLAQALLLPYGGGPVELVDLALPMPPCDAAGGFVAIPAPAPGKLRLAGN